MPTNDCEMKALHSTALNDHLCQSFKGNIVTRYMIIHDNTWYYMVIHDETYLGYPWLLEYFVTQYAGSEAPMYNSFTKVV